MSNLTVKGNASGTGTVILEAPNTNTNRTITLPDSTSTLATTADVAAISTGPTLGTAVASTSGTSIDFTGIPSTAKRVTVMLDGVSTNGTSLLRFQLGDSGGIETTGYFSMAFSYQSSAGVTSSANGFDSRGDAASDYARYGQLIFSLLGSNVWTATGGYFADYSTFDVFVNLTGSKTLSATLDRIRITTVNGTDTFDAGTINISWE